MNPSLLYQKFFSSESRGHKIISQFYYKYHDLFRETLFQEFADFLNQIFLNISRIDFSKSIQNHEAYIIGSIKIQCRAMLDKSIKSKRIISESRLEKDTTTEGDSEFSDDFALNSSTPNDLLEADELFSKINIFKLQLNRSELSILNLLIDEKTRKEISEETDLNLNTIDTKIRRLRIKLFSYLKELGYSLKSFEKFEI